MKQTYVIILIGAGSILVVLPLILGSFSRNQNTFQENYHKAMDRLRTTQQNYTDHWRHEEAIRQAADLEPTHAPGYLSQITGVCMIIVGVLRTRSRPVAKLADESAKSRDTSDGKVTSSTESKPTETSHT
jgi:hypothetical protein